MDNMIAIRRRELHDEMTALSVSPTPWRIHEYPPTTIASPCVWIDAPDLDHADEGWLVNWPVYVSVDSRHDLADLEQQIALLIDTLDAIDMVRVQGASPVTLDIGGPTTRGYVIRLAVHLGAGALCPEPELAVTT